MARAIHKLNARRVEALKTDGWYGDGGGLWLRIAADGSKRWVFRWRQGKKTREMGLGAFQSYGLVDARGMAVD